ncbi:MAG: tRNA (adenosine(37)-N6)-threonylcarbamoyltransferase complex ATPase subunit type 1 TsaE [Minisyncoccota bacterium]
MKIVSRSIQDTNAIARDLAGVLQQTKRSGRATILALKGDLGAGKTALTKSLAAVLGVKKDITSPTFVLEKIYTLPPSAQFLRLIHIDAYRLDDAKQLTALRWEEIIADEKNLVVLEWPERVEGAIPSTAVTLSLVFVDDTTREITIPRKISDVWPAKKKT